MKIIYEEQKNTELQGSFWISVVVPCYNVAHYIEETIESVLNQTIGFKEHIQLILVNDGSSDETGEICARYEAQYPDNIIYIEQENAGVSAARNHGYAFAAGKYINFLDGDDYWEADAYERLYAYMEEHTDLVLTCGRMRLFDAIERWHPLDGKFNVGGCVIDISQRPEDTLLHITSSFIRREAIGDLRFDTELKIGEDAVFVNTLILRNGKFGALREAVHMYRKRRGETSAVQTKHLQKDWYLVSPQRFYGKLVEESELQYHEVVPYIQALLFYDIGFRLRTPIPEDILSGEEEQQYLDMLRSYLEKIDNSVIMSAKNHAQEVRLYMLEMKYGCKVHEIRAGKAGGEMAWFMGLFASSILSWDTSFVYTLISYDPKKKAIHVSGKIRNIVMRLFGNSAELYLSVNKGSQLIKPEFTELVHDKFHFLDGDEPLYTQIEMDIPLKRKKLVVKPCLKVDGIEYPLGFCFGKFAHISAHDNSYAVMGSHVMYREGDALCLYRPKHRRLYLAKMEKAYQETLRHRPERIPMAKERLKAMRFGLFHKKKIWLISDREFVANDNGEHFFRYLNGEGKKYIPGIRPIFVISENCPDYARMKQYGEVVSYESEKYRILFLNADKIISSSGNDMVFNPYGKKRGWMADLYKFQYVFLQHGIIKDDLSDWLRKLNKNISMFVTSAKGEYDSIVNGAYGYTEKEVKLVGLCRFDNLTKLPYQKQKRILVLPTWRSAIRESYDSVTSESIYFDGFKDTEYFKFYNDLINHPRLLDVMRRKGYTGVFGIHPVHAKQTVDYQANDVFSVNDGYLDYQREFVENSMMVTDYSSTVMDFVYLKKPVVYAQFDKEEFFDSHTYSEGYFDYERDGFGPVCYDLESTVDAMVRMIENDCQLEPQYEKRVENFFAYTDDQNCKRTLDAIQSL